MDESVQELVTGAADLGIELTPAQRQQFADYAALLLEWNKRMNLVRVKGPHELMRFHMLDSLWCSAAMDLGGSMKLLDLGSGAGFPGIPLRICFPDLRMSLLESQQKRALFLMKAINCLGLDNSEVLTGRAEDLAGNEEYRERFDCVVARAVAPLATLIELSLPFVAIGGCFVALKGKAAEEETAVAGYALERLGGVLEKIVPYRYPGENGRNALSFKKIAPTPERYPRRPGIPAKRPLIEVGKE